MRVKHLALIIIIMLFAGVGLSFVQASGLGSLPVHQSGGSVTHLLSHTSKLSFDWLGLFGKITGYGLLAIVVVILVVLGLLWILGIPARLTIEAVGRLLGENPNVGNFGALLLMVLFSINFWLGLIAFLIKFTGQMGFGKALILAIVSAIVYPIFIAIFKLLVVAVVLGAVVKGLHLSLFLTVLH